MTELVAGGYYAALDAFTTDASEDMALARLASGGLAVAWVSGNFVGGYVIDANGNGGTFLVLSDLPDNDQPSNVTLAALPSGGFVAAWTDLAGDLVTRTYDATGTPTASSHAIPNLGLSGDFGELSVSALNSGGFVVAFNVSNDGSGAGIRAQLFDSAGSAVGSDFAVNSLTAGDQGFPIALGLSNGGYLISWADNSSHAYAGQFYDAAGHAVGGQVTLAAGADGLFDITALASGNLVIVWPGTDGELKGQIYTVSGIKVGGEFQVNSPTAGAELLPEITALDSGGFAVAWGSPANNGDIHAQVFGADGTKIGD
jgi:hypothetical protein